MDAGRLIATILRHDKKVTSYKLALIRSINDLVLGYPHIAQNCTAVAIPLKRLAQFWVAYYWPFVAQEQPIRQGQFIKGKQDISFRLALTQTRQEWEKIVGASKSSDGFYLETELRSENRRRSYPISLIEAHERAVDAMVDALQQPIRYAGPGEYSVFPRPQSWRKLQNVLGIVCLPGTEPADTCVLLEKEIWQGFCDLSLWIEALCIHEWCQLTHQLIGINQGIIYGLLTDRPGNRRPLTWERNNVEILMMEGNQFECPWTGKKLHPSNYDIDHLLPINVYPLNELWNLVPSDRDFNQHKKRDRMPGHEHLLLAQPRLVRTYQNYINSQALSPVLLKDAGERFPQLAGENNVPLKLADAVVSYLDTVSLSRNIAVF